MKYFIIAGEASGDLHASALIKHLKEKDSEAQVQFFGGDQMVAAAGVQPVVHYRDMAYMGFVEVIKHLREILGILDRAKNFIKEWNPDVVILVDYPSFNLKVAKFAHERGMKVFYYISPKLWAWKPYRIKQIRKYVDYVYGILPFEPAYYKSRGYEMTYVGNPTMKEIEELAPTFKTKSELSEEFGFDGGREWVALVPGSRKAEIRDNLPIMLRAAKGIDCELVITGAPNIAQEIYDEVLAAENATGLKVVRGETLSVVKASKVALVTSGTATLETALVGTPQVVCYRSIGTRLAYFLLSLLITAKFASLPNLIADEEIIPELLMHKCNEKSVRDWLLKLLADGDDRKRMLAGYERVRAALGDKDGAEEAARLIIERIKG